MNDYAFGAVIGSLAVGLIFGAIPMILGAFKNQLGLAFGGLIACVIGGLILGAILAIPLSGLFIWLILRANKKQQAQELSSIDK